MIIMLLLLSSSSSLAQLIEPIFVDLLRCVESSPPISRELPCAGLKLSTTLRFLFPQDIASESAGKKAIRRGFVILNGLTAKVTDVIQVCQRMSLCLGWRRSRQGSDVHSEITNHMMSQQVSHDDDYDGCSCYFVLSSKTKSS